MNKIDLRDTRHKNLLRLIADNFSGRQADFASAAKKNPTQVNHWISGHRNPNGDTCRDVERELNIPDGWLDQDHAIDINPTLPASLPNLEQNQPLAPVQQAQAATENVSPELAEQCRAVMAMLATLPDDPVVRFQVLGQLAEIIAKARGSPPSHQESPAYSHAATRAA